MPLIFKTITTNRASKLKLIAYQAAHQELESLRGQSVSSLTNRPFTVTELPIGSNGYVTINRFVEGSEQDDIAEVTSRVNWNFNGKNEQIELKTYLYGAE